MNVIFSSWPGAGGTTTALMVAYMLELDYLYAGGVLKEWAKRMGYDPTSDKFHEWENKYGVAWDTVWEAYVQEKLKQQDGFLYEGKTAGFLFPKGIAYEVMITADLNERVKRSVTDKRTETLKQRDELLQKRWQELFGFDLFSDEDIEENYDLRIDNTSLSIAQTTYKAMQGIKGLTQDYGARRRLDALESEYWKENETGNGKNMLISRLTENGHYTSNESVFAEMPRLVPEIFSKLPKEMQEAAN